MTVNQTHSPGDEFTVWGYELVKYTFTDAAGNEAVCEFAVTLYPDGELQAPYTGPTLLLITGLQ